MKTKRVSGRVFSTCVGLAILVSCAFVCLPDGGTARAQSAAAQAQVDPKHAHAFQVFEAQVKAYVSLRERIERSLPKLSKDAKPEEIESHKTAFQAAVRAARPGVSPGNIFLPEVAGHIRELIKVELPPADKKVVRETVLESEVKAVPVRVNYPYPESEEQVEMPPTLLLKLPQLPKQVKYRYVGRSLLLVDRENGLIVDFMPDALP